MDRRLVDRLRDDLERADYTVDRLRALWGDGADEAFARGDRVPARRGLRESDDRAAILARLLLIGDPVDPAEAVRALPSIGLDGAGELGVARVIGGEGGRTVRSALEIRPYSLVDSVGAASWWVASDHGEEVVGGALPVDHVLGIGGASTTLAGLQLPDPVDTALDLGTGSGIQALHAGRYAQRVIATDVSPRALRMAELSCALSGLDRVELRLGSLFDPVPERVDRIVSNPPFVITPRRPDVPLYAYRDAGLPGDALLEQIVRALPDRLTAGGIAQLLGNWEYRGHADGPAAVAAWATAAGLEHWIVERERLDPAAYAESWIRDGGTSPGSPEGERLVEAWLDDFSARGVTAVGFGYLLFRRSRGSSAPLARVERLPERLGENPAGLGSHLSTALRERDRIADLDDDEFAALTMRVAADVTEERSHRPGEADPAAIVLRQGGGFGRAIRVDPALAAVVGACDGDLALGALIDAVASLLDADPARLREALLPELRELVIGGLLVAWEPPSDG